LDGSNTDISYLIIYGNICIIYRMEIFFFFFSWRMTFLPSPFYCECLFIQFRFFLSLSRTWTGTNSWYRNAWIFRWRRRRGRTGWKRKLMATLQLTSVEIVKKKKKKESPRRVTFNYNLLWRLMQTFIYIYIYLYLFTLLVVFNDNY